MLPVFPAPARRTYSKKLARIAPAYQILRMPLNETSGLVARDYSPKANHGTYAGAGITYGVPGIGDGQTGVRLDGNNTYVNLDTSVITFDDDFNGNLYSMVAWGKVDGAARWTDAASYRYLTHLRATDATYYTVMGKSQTDHQLEWRRRSGGAIVSATYTFSPAGPLDYFCMGMTFNLTGPALTFYLNDSVNGWRKLSTSNSAALTDWGANPPQGGASVLGAGSLTLQEWFGDLAHNTIWSGIALSDDQMRAAMTL